MATPTASATPDKEKVAKFEERVTRHARRIVLELRKMGHIAGQKRSYEYTEQHVKFLSDVLTKEFDASITLLQAGLTGNAPKPSESLFAKMPKGK